MSLLSGWDKGPRDLRKSMDCFLLSYDLYQGRTIAIYKCVARKPTPLLGIENPAPDQIVCGHKVAQELFRARLYDDALAHYLWIWPASRKAVAWGGVRLSFLLGDMADLAEKHEASRRAFFEILDELQVRVDGAGTPAFLDWQEWSSMCEYFGEHRRVVVWYEKRRDERGRLFGGLPKKYPEPVIAAKVFDVLMEASRPLDAVRLFEDGVQRAEQILSHFKMQKGGLAFLGEEERKAMEEHQHRGLIDGLSLLYAGLLLDGRGDQAARVADLLLRTLDLPEARLGLVEAGIEIAKRREASFSRWLDEAEASGASVGNLRRRLEGIPAQDPDTPPGSEVR